MASRLRGMTILSSTIIPRAQRLLETKVLKERPIWLDVVEAYPPLPHPIIPEHLSTGRLRTIEYPEDAERTRILQKYIQSSRSATGRIVEMRTLSLFESWSVRKKKTDVHSEPVIASLMGEQMSLIETSTNEESLPVSTTVKEVSADKGSIPAIKEETDEREHRIDKISTHAETATGNMSTDELSISVAEEEAEKTLKEISTHESAVIKEVGVEDMSTNTSASLMKASTEKPLNQQKSSSRKTMPHFEDAISKLALMLKDHETKD